MAKLPQANLPLVIVWAFLLSPGSLSAARIFSIGNSLTGDTRPQFLDGTVDFYLDCGTNLQQAFANPSATCNAPSKLWSDALAATQYDLLTVQPYFGTTLSQDVAAISHWMRMQPHAKVIIHTGWSPHAQHETNYHSGDDTAVMIHSPEYFDALLTELDVRHPDRSISSTNAMDILDSIFHDIESGAAPFDDFADLYRDNIHMSLEGQYLMHNVMRSALGQPISDARIDGLSVDVVAYLNSKVMATVPEPLGYSITMAAVLLLVPFWRERGLAS